MLPEKMCEELNYLKAYSDEYGTDSSVFDRLLCILQDVQTKQQLKEVLAFFL